MSFSFDNKINEDIRVSSLKIDGKEVQTPFWVLNNVERKKLVKGVGLFGAGVPQLPFNEVVRDVTQQDLLDYLSDPESLMEFKKKIRRDCVGNTNNMIQLRITGKVNLSEQHLKQIISLQSDIDSVSILTIPDPITDATVYSERWESSMKSVMDTAQSLVDTADSGTFIPMISLDQRKKIVEKKVKWLVDRECLSIGFRAHGDFKRRLKSALEIIKLESPSTWVHLFDLGKKTSQISYLHLSPLFGVDTISLKKGYAHVPSRPSGKVENADLPEPKEPGLKRWVQKKPELPKDVFENRALGFLSESERDESFGSELDCKCIVCTRANGSLYELTKLLSQVDRKAILQVHENTAFPIELNELTKATFDNQIRDYYMEKSLVAMNKERLAKDFSIFR